MQKFIAVSFASLAFLATGSASALSYGNACVNVTRDLSMGSRGAEVTSLQRFLVSRDYPGSGSWMVTGKFGRATQAAVRNFQTEQHLSISGWVDSETRMAIDRVSCGGGGDWNMGSTQTNYGYSNPFSNAQPTIFGNQYPQPYLNNSYTPYNNGFTPFNNYSYGQSPVITSFSSNSGNAGTSITINGSGFDVANNVVYFGTQAVYAYTNNGSSLIVNVPTNISGVVHVYVQNARGTSNNLPFTINTNYNNTNNYGNDYGCNSSYGYGSCCGFGSVCPLTASYLNPTSGGVGTSVTVIGTGFSTTGNTVHFGVGVITGLTSPDGRSVSFTVPTQLSGYGSQLVTLGQYPISVTNSSGATSNTLTYTVTTLGSAGSPVISGVSGPTTLSLNTNGVWTLSVNNQGSNYTTASVTWGDQVYGAYLAAPQQVFGNGTQTITFSHSYSQIGTFTATFSVTNQNGQTNTSSVTVNVTNNGQNGVVTLSTASPTSGHVGTQVVLIGSGFSTLDNTVHFGNGGTQHVPSANGNTIYFTIPYAVSPCDLMGYGCASPTTLVTAGQYPIYVTNSSGTSGTLYFNVQ